MISADRVPSHTSTSAIVAVEIWCRNVHAATGTKPPAKLTQNRHGIKEMLDDLDESDSIQARETLQGVEARDAKIQSEGGLATSNKHGRDLDADRAPPIPLEGVDQKTHSATAVNNRSSFAKGSDTI